MPPNLFSLQAADGRCCRRELRLQRGHQQDRTDGDQQHRRDEAEEAGVETDAVADGGDEHPDRDERQR